MIENKDQELIYHFGPFTLHSHKRLVYEGKKEVKLSDRSFDILLAMAQAEGRQLSIEDLRERAWKGWIAESGTIHAEVSRLRKKLGGETNDHIKTCTGGGYKLGYEVKVEIEEERPEAGAAVVTDSQKDQNPFDSLVYALPEEGAAEIFLTFSRMASQKMVGQYPDAFMNYIHNDYQGFGMAIDYYGRTSPKLELELVVNMAFYWDERGRWAEGRERLRHALLRHGEGSSELKARALAWFGFMSYSVDDYKTANERLSEALHMGTQFGDDYTVTLALHALGCVAEAEGHYAKAIDLYKKSLVARERVEADGISPLGLKNTYLGLGNVARELGDFAGAENSYQTGLIKREEADDRRGIASSMIRLSVVAIAQGDLVRARILLDKSRQTIYGTPGKNAIALTQFNEGLIEAAGGQYEAALTSFKTCLELRREISEKRGVARAMEAIGKIYSLTDNEKEGARMLGAADALRRSAGCPMSPAEENRFAWLKDDIRKKWPKEFEEAGKRILEGIVIV